MLTIRTDLAVEAHALWRRRAGETAELTGVSAGETACEGLPLTHVEILDEEGARTLGKPRGRYFTLDVSALWQREEGAFRRCALAVAEILEPLIPKEGPVLVAGLGNRAMTPDALGPRTVDQLLVTRHLGELVPGLRPVAALAAGVLGDTGMEAAEWVRGGAEHIRPAGVIVIDALAAGDLERLCSSIQISDAGLTPGSGVGNHRKALDRDSLGVPVVSIGAHGGRCRHGGGSCAGGGGTVRPGGLRRPPRPGNQTVCYPRRYRPADQGALGGTGPGNQPGPPVRAGL